jgi:hypothetical protein
MIVYKLAKDSISGQICSVILTTEDGVIRGIPFDPANTDYQAYLKWVAEGNTPTPADEGTQ